LDILPTVKAVLHTLAGPLKGSMFALRDGELAVGREPTNEISILDGSVSRRHCLIRGENGGFTLEDLGSRNQTMVNGEPVTLHRLEPGDEICVGSTVLRFEVQSSDHGDSHTLVLRKRDAVYLSDHDDAASAKVQADERTVRDLNALLKLSRTVGSVRGLEALQREILQLVLAVIPADRASILMCRPRSKEFASVFSWDRNTGVREPVEPSHTVLNQVMDEGVAVLRNEVLDEGDELSAAESLVLRRIESVLAVPLEVLDRLLGVIYLETSKFGQRFDEGHLQVLAAVGSIAATGLENAGRLESLEGENQRLHEEMSLEHNMVGESPRMRDVFQFIQRTARTDATVLINGESGTGKELIARAIHRASPRAHKPFVALNCAALPENLLESELFGHERGAFTGAVVQKKGKLEVAEGGTVFLDEIGDMAPVLQAKLLRVLQEREFERVGGTKTIKMDVRILAATNRNLEESIRSGTFRQDLYFRLNVVSVRAPALRERREDIPLLAFYFANKYAERAKRSINGISPEARACLVQYEWPGNVRELENSIERAVVLGSTDIILPEDLPENVVEGALERTPQGNSALPAFHDGVREAKKHLVTTALEQSEGNITDAARRLGLHPNYLHRLMRNLNLRSGAKAK
jgi:transcriptional regulator with GAF, ATPase, and Fis domain